MSLIHRVMPATCPRLPKVCSQFVYTGNGVDDHKITTGLDLSTNKGIVVVGSYDVSTSYPRYLANTVDGDSLIYDVRKADAPSTRSDIITGFESDGFTVGTYGYVNHSGDNFFGFSIQQHASGSNKILDIVKYEGDGYSWQNVAHNLGATPGMMWIKANKDDRDWIVYYGNDDYILLLNDDTNTVQSDCFNSTYPTSTHFTVSGNNNLASDTLNRNGEWYIAILFANYPGVCKIGDYIGNGSTQNIDMGFSRGASLFIMKQNDNGPEWRVFSRSLLMYDADNNISPELSDGYGYSGIDMSYYSKGITVGNSNVVNKDGRRYYYIAFA